MTIGSRLRGRGPRGLSRFLGEHQRCGAGFDVGRLDGVGSGRLTVTCLGCGQEFLYESALGGPLPVGNALPASSLEPAGVEEQIAAAGEPEEGRTSARKNKRGDWYWGGPWTARERQLARGPRFAPRGAREETTAVAAAAVQETTKPAEPVEAEQPAPEALGGPPSPSPAVNGTRRWRRLLPTWWVDALIVAAMIGAAAVIVLGVTSDNDDSGDEPSAPAPTQAEEPAQSATPPAEPEQGGGEAAQQGEGGVARGERREFLSLYSLSVPDGWDADINDAVVELGPKTGDDVGVRVFFERRSGSPQDMKGPLRDFLKGEHRNADIGEFRALEIGSHDAVAVTATYGGNEETATLVAGPPFQFLIVTRIDESASSEHEQEAKQVAESFRRA